MPPVDKIGRLVCDECSNIESHKSIVLRSVDELQVLFPEKKITTMGLYDWCNGVMGEKTIQRHLIKNFTKNSRGRFSYYV